MSLTESQLPPFIRREEERVVQLKRGELYEGMVEYVDDPCNNGRAKVRVIGAMPPPTEQNIETDSFIATLDLPWALPCFMPGSFVVPEVGDTVLVFFRKGDVRYPVYLGVIYGVLAEEDLEEARIKGRLRGFIDPKPINREGNCASVGDYEAPSANNDISYEQPPGNDAPLESFMKRDSKQPWVRVQASTPKGHMMYTTDEPGKEALRIIDRGGQIFEMESNILAEENIGNMARRGIGEASSSTQLKIEKFLNGESRMQWMDARRQVLRFKGSQGSSKIRLSGIRPNEDPEHPTDYSKGSGWMEIREVRQEIEARSDLDGYWLLDSGFHAEDDKGAYIDIHNGTIELKSSGGAAASKIVISPGHIEATATKIDLN